MNSPSVVNAMHRQLRRTVNFLAVVILASAPLRGEERKSQYNVVLPDGTQLTEEQASPSLHDTVAYIATHLNYATGWGESGPAYTDETFNDEYRYETFITNGVLEIREYYRPDKRNAIASAIRVTVVNFGDLDPKSVSLEPSDLDMRLGINRSGYYEEGYYKRVFLTMNTTDERSLLRRRSWFLVERGKPFLIGSGYHVSRIIDDTTTGIRLYLSDRDLARRLANAFKHAIRLSGGQISKPKPPDPFDKPLK